MSTSASIYIVGIVSKDNFSYFAENSAGIGTGCRSLCCFALVCLAILKRPIKSGAAASLVLVFYFAKAPDKIITEC